MNMLENLAIILPAIAVGMMILLVHIPLGQEVLRRGIIFIDLAVAQMAGLGVVVAELLHVEAGWLIQLAALVFAMVAALGFRLTERYWPQSQEAVIGLSYVLAATVAMLLLSSQPQGADHFQQILSGEMLFVSWEKILAHLPVYGLVLAVWFALPRIREGLGFYVLFALAITSSVQLVGVFLVFASLIAPALILQGRALALQYAVSGTGLMAGVWVSLVADLPTTMVVVLSIVVSNLLVLCGGKLMRV